MSVTIPGASGEGGKAWRRILEKGLSSAEFCGCLLLMEPCQWHYCSVLSAESLTPKLAWTSLFHFEIPPLPSTLFSSGIEFLSSFKIARCLFILFAMNFILTMVVLPFRNKIEHSFFLLLVHLLFHLST